MTSFVRKGGNGKGFGVRGTRRDAQVDVQYEIDEYHVPREETSCVPLWIVRRG